MATQTAALTRATLTKVEKGEQPRPANGRLADGGGLFLQLNKGPGGSWVLRYQREGKERWLGLGSFPSVSATEARELAGEQRKLIRLGANPVIERAAQRETATVNTAATVTFSELAEMRIAAWKDGGKVRPKTLKVYTSFLRNHAIPALGNRALLDITPEDVMAAVKPILERTHHTGMRVRWHIEDTFAFGQEAGINKFPRERANPAAFNLMKRQLQAIDRPYVKHHAALPHADMPTFMNRLRANGSRRALAIMLCILTGLRSQEVRCARWRDIDIAKGEWKVPRAIMKEGFAHIVPLSPGARIILAQVRSHHQGGEWLFPALGKRFEKPMCESAMLSLLNNGDRGWNTGLTVHGFRSTLRDWGAEQGYRDDAMEWVIAHGVPNDKTVAAYKRTTFFEERAKIMTAWSGYCMPRHLEAVAA